MARPSKAQAVDFTKPQKLSHGLLERAACPEGETFVLVRDVDHPGLRLRVTAAGGKRWQFEARIQGKLFTRSLGAWPAVSIGEAQSEARELRTSAVGDVWPLYLEQGRPKRKDAWKPRYLADLKAMAATGGEKKKRGQGNTRPGPLYPLLALPLAGVNEDSLKSWYDREA
jgi:hypothetical protein